jgi:(1->4)-alpha-D-glucan 1-alpha-D-glucosylmutase
VDYELRSAMLSELQGGMGVEEILHRMDSGLPKLFVAHIALCARRDRPDWFGAEAGYTPLAAEGSKSEHLVGFLRGDSVAVLTPRWPLKLGGYWASTTVRLPAGEWMNLFTRERIAGGRVRVQTILQQFPVALLAKKAE